LARGDAFDLATRDGLLDLEIKDRLTRGFVAGLVGGVAMNVVSLASYYLNLGELRYLDWAGIMMYGFRPHNFLSAAFAQVIQILQVGILGAVFAYLLPLTTSRNYLLKGWLYGTALWFGFNGLTLLFKLGPKIPVHLATAAVDFVGASVYGLVLAHTLHWLDEKVKA